MRELNSEEKRCYYAAYKEILYAAEYQSIPLNTEMLQYITSLCDKLKKEYKDETGKNLEDII